LRADLARRLFNIILYSGVRRLKTVEYHILAGLAAGKQPKRHSRIAGNVGVPHKRENGRTSTTRRV